MNKISNFLQVGRPKDTKKHEVFETLCLWLEENAESGIYTLADVHQRMASMIEVANKDPKTESADKIFNKRYLKEQLLRRYGEDIFFTSDERRSDIMCFKSRAKEILRDHHQSLRNDDGNEDMKIIKTAVKLIKNSIKEICIDATCYASKEDLTKDYDAPAILSYFIDQFASNKEQANIWKQAFIKAVRPRSGPMPYLLALGIQLDHKYGSKWLTQRIKDLGLCESPDELRRYKWCYLKAKHDRGQDTEVGIHARIDPDDVEEENDSDEESEIEVDTNLQQATSSHSEEDSEISFDESNDFQTQCSVDSTISEGDFHMEQYVADNIDINIRSLYGNSSYHAMGRIKIITPDPGRASELKQISRRKITAMEKDDLLKKLGIKLHTFHPKPINALCSIKFMSYSELQQKTSRPKGCLGDSAWLSGWLIKMSVAPDFFHGNWKGHMKMCHQESGAAVSSISYLQIINSKPDNYSTVYTTLLECLKTSQSKPIIVTFDLPLWIKAIRIVVEMKMPAVVRLGGFHLLKSFLGSVGFIMKDSGLEEVFQCLYPGEDTVDKILSGGAYYKALRANFLVDAALCSFLLKNEFSDEELKDMQEYIIRCRTNKLGAKNEERIVKYFDTKIQKKLQEVSDVGRTSKLWIQYHSFVNLIKDFIRAERMHDHDLHLACVVRMLPVFAAAGHTQYAKGARLYVELMHMNTAKHATVKSMFKVHKLHTIRYSTAKWSGIWTDLSIEQTLMKSIKSRGGLTGGRLRNQKTAQKLWVSLLDHQSSVDRAVEEARQRGKKVQAGKTVHPDMASSARKKDFNGFQSAYAWFEQRFHYEEQESDVLMSLSTGLISKYSGEGAIEVNADLAIAVGVAIQESLDGGSFVDKMSTKSKVKNLSLLKKPVKVSNVSVVVDLLKLFFRLIAISEREISLKESLSYELTQLPLALFDKELYMRKPNKAALGKYLKDVTEVIECPANTKLIIDGGWLLRQCSFVSGESYGTIIEKYVRFVKERGKQTMVIFDGYNSSPKDHDHQRRSKDYSATLVLHLGTPCTTSKARFMANSRNKSQLITLLSDALQANGVDVLIENDDADTAIVREGLSQSQEHDVEIRVEDTDVVCLFVHHCFAADNELFLTTSEGSYNIKKIRNSLPEKELKYLLFSHSFSGCDTVSSIYGLGKVNALKKLSSDKAPSHVLEKIVGLRVEIEDIKTAGVTLFQYLYGNPETPLNQQRYDKYNNLTAKKVFKPEKLPPTADAAAHHSLRAYLQFHDWIMLQSQSLDPTQYGWKRDNVYEPIGMQRAIAPEAVLKLIFCNCQFSTDELSCNTARCSCRKSGMKCISACGNCHGLSCANSISNDDMEDSSEES